VKAPAEPSMTARKSRTLETVPLEAKAANEGEENKVLQNMVKGFLPSGGDGEMPSSPQETSDQSGGGLMTSLPGLPQGLSGQ